MKLSRLIESITPIEVINAAEAEIPSLHYDSRQVEQGGCFFAISGSKVDGRLFISSAIERGARVLVAEELGELPPQVTGLKVSCVRRAMAAAAMAFYEDPAAGMLVIGITGTNGKTTGSYLMESVLAAAGRRPAVFGTVDYRFGEHRMSSSHTTPESLDLMRMVSRFRELGADSLILEVSSHALEQFRADGLDFDLAIFTNLTPEHLDYHGEMEAYFRSKSRLFGALLARKGGISLINADDLYGQRLMAMAPRSMSYGMQAACEVRCLSSSLSLAGIEARVQTPAGELEIRSSLVGDYNLHNLLGAVAASVALGIELPCIERGLAGAPQVPGRMERIDNALGACILVDYAHTGDALEKALAAVAQAGPRRIFTVFGCGGDRDRSKRPVMGEVAARYSRLAVLTSDNPRSEDPARILEDVCAGIRRVHPEAWSRKQAEAKLAGSSQAGFVVIEDRREAIRFAVSLLEAGDLLLVAGKGHEDYQILATGKIHFDDREELRDALGLEARR